MWIFNFIPSWTFQLTFFIGIVIYLVATTLKVLPYSTMFKYGSIALVFFSTFLLGAQSNDDTWRKRAAELELKVKELEVKSTETNTKIVEKVVTKKQLIKQKGDDIIQYVDREVVKNQEVIKYIEHCPKLPDEIVTTINKAAKP